MQQPYLIQRLLKPFAPPIISELFSFGGGLKNGGLSDEAMKLLRKIWRYDYMGSAEFEFGAVPRSLREIAKNISKYKTGDIDVDGMCRDLTSGKELKATAKIFYVCPQQDEKEVCEWIQKFADDRKRDYRTKERVSLSGAICQSKYHKDIAGWHDIDNHYLFFTDKGMFESFCALFELLPQKQSE